MTSPTPGRLSPRFPATTADAVQRARELRPMIAEGGAAIDAQGKDPASIMKSLAGAGLQALSVPTVYGGLWHGPGMDGYAELLEAWMEIAAGDGSVGQLWGFSAVATRLVLSEAALPDETRAQIAHEVLHEGRRVAGQNSERGADGPTVARPTRGGIVLSGTKAFGTNTGAGGRDLALVTHLLVDERGDVGSGRPHKALVRLDAPGVEAMHDWDNMGQRGTESQTIHYRDVFVPDGWYYEAPLVGPNFMIAALLGNAALLQGIGDGALAAAVTYLKDLDRAGMPMFTSTATDPIIHRRLGGMSARLAGSRALTLAVARRFEGLAKDDDPTELVIGCLQADVQAADTSVDVCSEIFELTGARSTANTHRLDRFWRNARTMSSHHNRDALRAIIGYQMMNHTVPNFADYVKF
jgi:alkylation response protein AidB-like acyl-CoA dehydrogenase